jgi:hypothetical protein
VAMEMSRRFMGRLSLTRGAGSEARAASSVPPRRHPQAGGGGLRSRSYCCCSRPTTVVMSANSDCTGSTSGSILSTSHVKLFSPLYGRILTALVPRRLGSFCSAARSTASISDAKAPSDPRPLPASGHGLPAVVAAARHLAARLQSFQALGHGRRLRLRLLGDLCRF